MDGDLLVSRPGPSHGPQSSACLLRARSVPHTAGHCSTKLNKTLGLPCPPWKKGRRVDKHLGCMDTYRVATCLWTLQGISPRVGGTRKGFLGEVAS